MTDMNPEEKKIVAELIHDVGAVLLDMIKPLVADVPEPMQEAVKLDVGLRLITSAIKTLEGEERKAAGRMVISVVQVATGEKTVQSAMFEFGHTQGNA